MNMSKQRTRVAAAFSLVVLALACSLPTTVTPMASRPVVSITSPPYGAQLTQGQEVLVQVSAADSTGIVRVELWVDNVLSATAQPPTPQTAYLAALRWIPNAPGAHMLTAKAINANGGVSEPASIAISVMDAGEGKTPSPASTPTTKPPISPTPRTGNFIVNVLSGKCIDVPGKRGVANGLVLCLWDCEFDDPNTDQRWELTSDGFIRNTLSGKCIDVSGKPGMANGLVLQLWDCELSQLSTTDQRWELTSEGFIKNTLSGKCVDVPGKQGTANGAQLQLWDCEFAQPAATDQRWMWK